MIWAFIKSGAGKIVGIVVLVLAALGLAQRSGRIKAENKRTEERLDAINKHKKTEKEIADADRDKIIDINSKP